MDTNFKYNSVMFKNIFLLFLFSYSGISNRINLIEKQYFIYVNSHNQDLACPGFE